MTAHASDEDRWLTSAADAAFQQAASKVIERARQAGTPVAIWQDGHVEEIPSDKLLPNVWANALAIEHRGWLRKFDNQYLKYWENLLGNDQEAALTESRVRRLLQHHGAIVEPNESLTGDGRRPDFRCTVGDNHFYVEATCVQIATAEKKTGVKNLATGILPYNKMGMIEAIHAKCKEKASPFADLDRPALLAIGTFHAHAAMDFSERFFANLVLTGKAAMAWDIDTSGQPVGETSDFTGLEAAAFLRPDTTQGVGFARSSISGLLLCGFGFEPPRLLGVLHPNPVRPFDPALLPGIQFARLELDRASDQLTIQWPEGGD
ncbi:MAG TPA: hypothetical protein VIK18_01850 [Pirellulales bacterium]